MRIAVHFEKQFKRVLKMQVNFIILFFSLIVFVTESQGQNSLYRVHFHNHQVPSYKLRQSDPGVKECDKEKDSEISNQFARTLTHESVKNSRYEPYEEEEMDQKNIEEEYEEMKTKVARSVDNKDDEKCGDNQDRRNDFMGSWGSGTSSKKTTNIALKAAQEAKAAEEGKIHFSHQFNNNF